MMDDFGNEITTLGELLVETASDMLMKMDEAFESEHTDKCKGPKLEYIHASISVSDRMLLMNGRQYLGYLTKVLVRDLLKTLEGRVTVEQIPPVGLSDVTRLRAHILMPARRRFE